LSYCMILMDNVKSQIPPAGYLADFSENIANFHDSNSFIINQDSLRWDLLKIQAPDAWPLTSGGNGVLVAILDTGIDTHQNYLIGKVIDRKNFTSDEGIDVYRGHGTHIAGLIGASLADNDISGVARNCSFFDIKVAQNDGSTDAYKVAQGIIWAVDNGAQILNISIVINESYPFLEYATQYAWDKGCLIIAAAGNTASYNPVFPAAYPHVLGVSATDKQDSLAVWSNRGDWVDLAAPGVDIYSTLPNNCFGTRSGSSYSTALVSGEAALLYPNTVDLNSDNQINDEVTDLILNNCDDISWQSLPGKRINVYKSAMADSIISETFKNVN
jgi:thermitase